MTVLVTGGTGVLGRCAVGRLVAAGHRVRVLSRDPSRASTVRDVELCAGDLRESASPRPALSDVKYYRAKRDVESIVEHQAVPWTIQRGFQPVAVEQVANRVAHHVESGAAGRAADLGGPEVLALHGLASTWLSATGRRRRPLLPVPFPGAVGRAFEDGANPCPGESSGGLTWTQYLDGSPSVREGG